MANGANSYPFPSKIHVSSSVTEKLSENNYLAWKTQFEFLLKSQKLLGFVNGSISAPARTIQSRVGDETVEVVNPQFEAWECTDQLILSWIFGTLSAEVIGCVYGLSTSHDVWVALANDFNKNSLAREFELRRRLQLISNRGKDFTTYTRDFKTLCDQLSSIGKSVAEDMKIFTFMNGLSSEYDPICTALQSSMSRGPQPTFSDIISEISGFDSKLQSRDTAPDPSPHLAFQAGRGQYNRGRGQHYGRSGGQRGRTSYSTRGRGFHQQLYSGSTSSFGNEFSNKPTCQICGKVGHIALKCYNRFNNAYQSDDLPQAMVAVKLQDHYPATGTEWYPDTGASAHITSSPSHLNSAQPYEGDDSVIVGNGNSLPITHIGSIALPSLQGQGDKPTSNSRKQA